VRTEDQVVLRLPDGLRPALKARAALNRRSMNAEIVLLIEAALASKPQDQPKTN